MTEHTRLAVDTIITGVMQSTLEPSVLDMAGSDITGTRKFPKALKAEQHDYAAIDGDFTPCTSTVRLFRYR